MAQGLSSLHDFRAAAQGIGSAKQHPILPDTSSPGVALTALFAYQSYFDSTLLEKAILLQAQNEPIVDSTLKRSNVGGYSFGLHPASQTPVAVQPIIGGQGGSPQAVILVPGQIYRPHGRPGNEAGHFSGLNWGLPFGWLGGGMATLYVFPSADADVHWNGRPEIIIQRQRMAIIQPAAMPGAAPKNWPFRFPWTQAVRGADSVSQKGAGLISLGEPTRTLISLRSDSLTNPASARFVFHEDNDFDLDAAGAVIPDQARFIDYTFGSYAVSGAANLTSQYPVDDLSTGPINRLAADDGGMMIMDASGGSLAGLFVDVVRYGRL